MSCYTSCCTSRAVSAKKPRRSGPPARQSMVGDRVSIMSYGSMAPAMSIRSKSAPKRRLSREGKAPKPTKSCCGTRATSGRKSGDKSLHPARQSMLADRTGGTELQNAPNIKSRSKSAPKRRSSKETKPSRSAQPTQAVPKPANSCCGSRATSKRKSLKKSARPAQSMLQDRVSTIAVRGPSTELSEAPTLPPALTSPTGSLREKSQRSKSAPKAKSSKASKPPNVSASCSGSRATSRRKSLNKSSERQSMLQHSRERWCSPTHIGSATVTTGESSLDVDKPARPKSAMKTKPRETKPPKVTFSCCSSRATSRRKSVTKTSRPKRQSMVNTPGQVNTKTSSSKSLQDIKPKVTERQGEITPPMTPTGQDHTPGGNTSPVPSLVSESVSSMSCCPSRASESLRSKDFRMMTVVPQGQSTQVSRTKYARDIEVVHFQTPQTGELSPRTSTRKVEVVTPTAEPEVLKVRKFEVSMTGKVQLSVSTLEAIAVTPRDRESPKVSADYFQVELTTPRGQSKILDPRLTMVGKSESQSRALFTFLGLTLLGIFMGSTCIPTGSHNSVAVCCTENVIPVSVPGVPTITTSKTENEEARPICSQTWTPPARPEHQPEESQTETPFYLRENFWYNLSFI